MPATARWNGWPGASNQRPSSSAIGLAPIATMSRRIPPIPVAAPWKGSTADGWLFDSTLLATVALLWGASFLFIKVAVRELHPATLIMGRLGLGALTLAAIVPVTVGGRRTVAEIRHNAGWLLVVALVNVALPFWLLSWGETRIDSGLASILQAADPIFNTVVACGFFREA